MSKRMRFWLTMAVGIIVIVPLYHYLKSAFPLAHELIVLVANISMFVLAFRYIYDHWN